MASHLCCACTCGAAGPAAAVRQGRSAVLQQHSRAPDHRRPPVWNQVALRRTALRVAYMDGAVSSGSMGDDGDEQRAPSTPASTSQQQRPLTSVGQSCLVAFDTAVKIAQSEGKQQVARHHLLLALLRCCNLPFGVSHDAQLEPRAGSGTSSPQPQQRQAALGVAFSDSVAGLLQAASRLARQLGAVAVEAEHLLAALLDMPAEVLSSLARRAGVSVDVSQLRTHLLSALHSFSAPQPFSAPAYTAITTALARSPSSGSCILTTLQLLAGLLASEGAAATLLQDDYHVTPAKVDGFISEQLHNVLPPQLPQQPQLLHPTAPGSGIKLPADAFQPDSSIKLHRLPCTPQAKLALQLAVQSAASRQQGAVTSLDMLCGLLQAHTDSEQDWCDQALQHVGASPQQVMAHLQMLLLAAPACEAESQELDAPLHAWLQPNAYVWN